MKARGASQHIQARLRASHPREREALEFYAALIDSGWSPRQVLTAALEALRVQMEQGGAPQGVGEEVVCRLEAAVARLEELAAGEFAPPRRSDAGSQAVFAENARSMFEWGD